MDREAHEVSFDQFVVARAAQLRRTAVLIVRDWHAAEDVVQTVLIRLFVAWPRLNQTTIDAYARRAVVNASISHTRKHRREWLTNAVRDQVEPDRDELSTPVLDALGELTAAQRAVVALRFFDDLSVAEVASALNVSESTVKTHTTRALATLRQVLPEVVPTAEETT